VSSELAGAAQLSGGKVIDTTARDTTPPKPLPSAKKMGSKRKGAGGNIKGILDGNMDN
jgi:hypothetical protein